MQNKDFERGVREFQEGNIKQESVRVSWYSVSVPKTKWNSFYSQISGGYTLLGEDKETVTMGFLAVHAPEGGLEITSEADLRKIDEHRKAYGALPRPFSF